MLRKLLCLCRGHESGECVYRNEDLDVYKCKTCGTQYPVFTLAFHFQKVVAEEGYEHAERIVGQWLS